MLNDSFGWSLTPFTGRVSEKLQNHYRFLRSVWRHQEKEGELHVLVVTEVEKFGVRSSSDTIS